MGAGEGGKVEPTPAGVVAAVPELHSALVSCEIEAKWLLSWGFEDAFTVAKPFLCGNRSDLCNMVTPIMHE